MERVFDDKWYVSYDESCNKYLCVSPYRESIVGRIRVLFGHYYCPDCYQWKCNDRCARRYQMELAQIEKAIDNREFDEARKLIAELAIKTDDDEPELTGMRTKLFLYEDDEIGVI